MWLDLTKSDEIRDIRDNAWHFAGMPDNRCVWVCLSRNGSGLIRKTNFITLPKPKPPERKAPPYTRNQPARGARQLARQCPEATPGPCLLRVATAGPRARAECGR